jgi:hypothetical protein
MVLVMAIIPSLKLVYLFKELISVILNSNNNLRRWKRGYIVLEDIYNLTPKEFEFWCGEFISRLGYTKIIYSPNKDEDTISLICRLYNEKVYVVCKKFLYTPATTSVINEDICKKLIGSMLHDGVKRGIIITSGIIADSAIKYINSLPKFYKFELLDGADIINQYSILKEKKPIIIS